jgi:type I restriction enzyme S subunit
MASKGDVDAKEIMPKLYEDWKKVPFEQCLLKKNGTYVKLQKKEISEKGKFPVIDQGETFISGYVDEESLIYSGEIPVVIFGDHTRIIKYVDFPFAVGADGTKILSPNDALNSKFFYYFLKSLKIPSFGYSRHYKALRSVSIPLPPLPEQHRIVAKLDAVLGKVGSARERLERLPGILQRFRQSVLAQAVSGKLTEGWREENAGVESAEELVARISKSFKTESVVKSKKELGADYLQLIENKPEGWAWVKWHQVGYCQNGRSFPSTNYTESGIKLLRPGNLHVSGELSWTESNTKFLPLAFENEFPDYVVGENELLINLTAQSLKDEFLGRVCVSSNGEKCLLNQRIARIHPVLLDVKFCLILFKSNLFRRFVDGLNTGTLIQHMFTWQVDQFQFPLPPLPEQKEIVRRVQALFAVADRLEERYEALREKVEGLPQAVLAKAFRGELVGREKE